MMEMALRLERQSISQSIGAIATDSLLQELETWPKPGLVSHIDNGSHDDMNIDVFRASAIALEPYFEAFADAGARGRRLAELRRIGFEAEHAMLQATLGVNTHRGAIFGLGLLCAATGVHLNGEVDGNASLGSTVSRLWAEPLLLAPTAPNSHGSFVRRRFGAGGARLEAITGFPSIYEIGLPALRSAEALFRNDTEAARVQVCFALIAHLEDTNLLHRGGLAGLEYARDSAQRFLCKGGIAADDWRERARAIHDDFVARRLSPGGSADLLAMTLFVEAVEGPLGLLSCAQPSGADIWDPHEVESVLSFSSPV